MRFCRREFLQKTAAVPFLACAAGLSGARKRIRIGCCAPVREIKAAAEAGFDYLEPGAAEIAGLTPAEFERVRNDVRAAPIRCEAFNSFIRRKELVVVGPEVNLPAVQEYADFTLERCRALGGEIMVWGSAGSRRVPQNFSRERAWEQIATFLQTIAPIAARRRMVVSIEPLNRKECNILNTGREVLKMVNEVNLREVRMTIDYYHLRMENEDLGVFEEARAKIDHIHFARPEGRLWPKSADEDGLYPAFFETLRRIHWTGGISIEGNGSVEADGRQSLQFFRDELGS